MPKPRLVTALGTAGALIAFVAGGCGSDGDDTAAGGEEPTKVTIMYAGPQHDEGYHQGFFEVGEAIEEALGDEVEVTSADNVPYTEKSGTVAQQLVATGTDIIIDTAVYGEPVDSVCREHPDEVVCLTILPLVLAGEGELAPNMAGFYPEFWKGNFVLGAAAGLVTETNVLGAVNPLEIPLTNSFMNSFLLGCQYTNPACKMRIVTTNTYTDPPAASRAANTLADAGADVITGWVNDGSPCVAAEKRGTYAVGHYYDYSDSCPNASIGTVLWSGDEWEEWFIDAVRNVREGTFEEEQGGQTHAIKFGAGTEALLGNALPEDARAEVEAISSEVESGELNPFVGPLVDTDGETRVPKGEELDLDTLIYGWDWRLEGLIGS